VAVVGLTKPSLSPASQRVLAVWSFLKVITLEIGRPADEARAYPDDIYTAFHESKEPPASSCAVYLGRRDLDPGSDPYVWFRSQGGKGSFDGLGERGQYRTALVIGHLVIGVIGVLAREALVRVSDEDRRLVRIWPVAPSPIDLPVERFKGIENNDLV
jgi:hypothetical protein